VEDAPRHMRKGGYLLFEIGYNQGAEVSKMMKNSGFSDVKILKDYSGLDRVVYGIKV
jgi:release factor glutamine methyltransferase